MSFSLILLGGWSGKGSKTLRGRGTQSSARVFSFYSQFLIGGYFLYFIFILLLVVFLFIMVGVHDCTVCNNIRGQVGGYGGR